MPFEIVRNDIINMQVDAIVNAANPKPVIGYGVDSGIHKRAGSRLLEAREKIGDIAPGQAAITPGFGLDAKYVIHAVGPVWQDGHHQERRLLTLCYESSLQLAAEHHCESVAFPLLSAGNYGFPKELALQIAVGAFSHFLMEHEMQIYLVVFGGDELVLSEKLFRSVESFIDDNYMLDKMMEEYGVETQSLGNLNAELTFQKVKRQEILRRRQERRQSISSTQATGAPLMDQWTPVISREKSLDDLLNDADATFSETLLKLIDRQGKTDPEVYKKANVDRRLFSKIRNNAKYQPNKTTALAFAMALELDLDETRDFIAKAGYALSHSSKADIIVEYFILHNNYDIFELDQVLFAFEQPLIGS